MTTIAYDGKTIAWDGMSTTGTEIITRNQKKKIRLDLSDKGNIIFGMSGCLPLFDSLIEWFLAGYDPDAMPTDNEGSRTVFFALGYRKGLFPSFNRCQLVVFSTDCQYPDYSYNHTKFAIGSGQDFATGAMHAGASATEAVRIAANLDVYTGGEIYYLDVEAALNEERTTAFHVDGGETREELRESV